MPDTINPHSRRMVIYAGAEKKSELTKEARVDPRFDGLSPYVMHLIELGREADKKSRADQSAA